MLIFILFKLNGLQKRYRKLSLGQDDTNLEKLLLSYRQVIDDLKKDQAHLEQTADRVESMMENAILGVGLNRYNAFKDTGSDLSFSLALLNKHHQGVVLTSLFGREETRVYAKELDQGKSSYHLSEEEAKAISQAEKMMKQL